MNKGELIDAVAAASGMKKADADKAVNSVLDTITGTLAKGEDVRIIGFGNFVVRERAERMSRNPRTGEAIKVPAMKSPAFAPGKNMKDALKGA
jgi:DNA-binding protein HU-beta